MKFYSTNDRSLRVSARRAVTTGLAPDGGLYMPLRVPVLPSRFLDALDGATLSDIAFEVSRAFLEEDVPAPILRSIVDSAIDFDAPLEQLAPGLYVQELFHGPSMAFKDFGARFMAHLMGYFQRGEDRELLVLVATSGDTGSAVAQGFFGVDGVRVVILYPRGRVSDFQERQLSTLGANVRAIEVKGTFDDCQRLVKAAFVDRELEDSLRLASANSINIARLIPQSFYYFYAIGKLRGSSSTFVVSVPCGNLGNLTAGVLAKKMGLDIKGLIAATNVNSVFPEYLSTGAFAPRPAVPTLSNAMDVGNPSNYRRLAELYGQDAGAMRLDIRGASFSDRETLDAIDLVYRRYGYVLDPHGAVAFLGWKSMELEMGSASAVILETAHPAKFSESVEAVIGRKVVMPERGRPVLEREKRKTPIKNDLSALKNVLLSG